MPTYVKTQDYQMLENKISVSGKGGDIKNERSLCQHFLSERKVLAQKETRGKTRMGRGYSWVGKWISPIWLVANPYSRIKKN